MNWVHANSFLSNRWYSSSPYWPKVKCPFDVVNFNEDMFNASRGSFILDLGWYPDGNPDGRYCLRLVDTETGGWENPIFEVKTRDNHLLDRVRDLLIEEVNRKIRARERAQRGKK